MKNKPILAFDCASGGASVSLRAAGQTQTRTIPQNRQAAELVGTIDALMRESTLSYRDLGCMITTVGPGSFTGLRIGLAALHGLVLVAKTPIKTLTTLEAMAWSVARNPSSPERFIVAMRAGKGEVYAQEFSCSVSIPRAAGEIFLKPETYAEWPLPCFANHLATDSPYYLAGADTEIMCDVVEHLKDTPLAEALPLYIRPPDALLPS